MNKHLVTRFFDNRLFLAGALLLVLILLASLTGVASSASKNDLPKNPGVSNVNQIDAAMTNIAKKYGSLTQITDPGDVSDYRWLAMAKAYEAQQNVDAGAAFTAGWNDAGVHTSSLMGTDSGTSQWNDAGVHTSNLMGTDNGTSQWNDAGVHTSYLMRGDKNTGAGFILDGIR